MFIGIWSQNRENVLGTVEEPVLDEDSFRMFSNYTFLSVMVITKEYWDFLGHKAPPHRYVVVYDKDMDYNVDEEGVYVAHSTDEVLELYNEVFPEYYFCIVGTTPEFIYEFSDYYNELRIAVNNNNDTLGPVIKKDSLTSGMERLHSVYHVLYDVEYWTYPKHKGD